MCAPGDTLLSSLHVQEVAVQSEAMEVADKGCWGGMMQHDYLKQWPTTLAGLQLPLVSQIRIDVDLAEDLAVLEVEAHTLLPSLLPKSQPLLQSELQAIHLQSPSQSSALQPSQATSASHEKPDAPVLAALRQHPHQEFVALQAVLWAPLLTRLAAPGQLPAQRVTALLQEEKELARQCADGALSADTLGPVLLALGRAVLLVEGAYSAMASIKHQSCASEPSSHAGHDHISNRAHRPVEGSAVSMASGASPVSIASLPPAQSSSAAQFLEQLALQLAEAIQQEPGRRARTTAYKYHPVLTMQDAHVWEAATRAAFAASQGSAAVATFGRAGSGGADKAWLQFLGSAERLRSLKLPVRRLMSELVLHRACASAAGRQRAVAKEQELLQVCACTTALVNCICLLSSFCTKLCAVMRKLHTRGSSSWPALVMFGCQQAV